MKDIGFLLRNIDGTMNIFVSWSTEMTNWRHQMIFKYIKMPLYIQYLPFCPKDMSFEQNSISNQVSTANCKCKCRTIKYFNIILVILYSRLFRLQQLWVVSNVNLKEEGFLYCHQLANLDITKCAFSFNDNFMSLANIVENKSQKVRT